MKTETHTPGPWRLHDMEENTVVAETRTGGEAIADCNAKRRPDDENAANARLIAAAPELLAALKDLVADSDDTDDGVIATVSAATLVRARQAIAKAESRQ